MPDRIARGIAPSVGWRRRVALLLVVTGVLAALPPLAHALG